MPNNKRSSPAPLLTKTLAKRGQHFVELLRCPVAGSPLDYDGTHFVSQDNPTLVYRHDAGLLRLVTDSQQEAFDFLTRQETAKKQAAGWTAPTVEAFRKLPQSGIAGWPLGYWQRRALATAELWRILEAIRVEEEQLPIGPMGTAVDLTDGLGWLGYGLDVSGYVTVVIGQDDGPYGLSVFPYTRYLRVQTSLTAPPLAAEQFDLVTFSFSLERLEDPALAVSNAISLLNRGGLLVILSDYPEGQSLKHLDQAQTALESMPESLQLRVWRQRVGPMGRNRFSRIAQSMIGRVPDMPPLLIARREK